MASYTKYNAVPTEDPQLHKEPAMSSAFDYSSAFSYKSAFEYDSNSASHYKSAFDFGYGPKNTNPMGMETGRKLRRGFSIMHCITVGLTVISYIIIGLTFPCTIWFCLKRLKQWERLIVFRVGHLKGTLGPGMVFVIPWLDRYTRVDMRTKAFSVPPQQLITADNGIIEMGCEVKYRVSDVERLTTSVTSPEHGLRSFGKVVLLNVLSKKTVREMEKDRLLISAELLKELNARVLNWGVEIGQVELSNVTILKEAEPDNPLKPILNALGNKSTADSGPEICHPPGIGGSVQPPATSLLDFGTIAKMAGLSSFQGLSEPRKAYSAQGNPVTSDLIQFAEDTPRDTKGSSPATAPKSKLGRYLQTIVSSPGGGELSNGVYRLQVEGKDGGTFVIFVANGIRQVIEGDPPQLNPDVSVVITKDDLTSVLEGTLSPLQAYLSGRFTVTGNVQLLMGLETLRHANTSTQKDMFIV